jgi:hypothetical protein
MDPERMQNKTAAACAGRFHPRFSGFSKAPRKLTIKSALVGNWGFD